MNTATIDEHGEQLQELLIHICVFVCLCVFECLAKVMRIRGAFVSIWLSILSLDVLLLFNIFVCILFGCVVFVGQKSRHGSKGNSFL